MQRHRSLVPLSHQHHNGLALCVLVERALAADASIENLARQAQRVVDRFDLEMTNHFALEEKLLFPAVPHPAVPELVAEHRRLEAIVAQLREAPASEALRDYMDLIRSHIRKEERGLFEDLPGMLPRETLDALGAEFEARAVRVLL